jgi:signal peptidase I
MIRWLFSKTIREAVALRKHVRHWYRAQRDLLSPQAIGAVTLAMDALTAAINEAPPNKGRIRIKMEELEFAANKWLKPHPNAVWRENVEVLLVAIAVAMGVRTFFIQPFKIPTGSMQPTLYGVTSTPDFGLIFSEIESGDESKAVIQTEVNRQLKLGQAVKIPNVWGRIKDWFHGISYVHFVAPTDGSVEQISKPWPPEFFSLYQRIEFAGQWYYIWFPPDYGEEPLRFRAGLDPNRVFHKGEDVIKLRVHTGDHLFVDRLTYNFRQPERGEIVVFETKGIPEDERAINRIPANEFYIKRLVGLGGETLSLKQDYEVAGVPFPQFDGKDVPVGNLVVNGKPLSASTPHFANLYSFSNPPAGAKVIQYQDDHYYGHALIGNLSPGQEVHIPPDHYFVMGDNTMNSLDSRYWGDFSSQYVIGKSFFVYWPITKRFGWGNQ